MKISRRILYAGLMFVVVAGSICAPNIMFDIIDNNALGKVTEIQVDDNNILTTKTASLMEKLELFGRGFEAIKVSIGVKEQEKVVEKVNKKVSSFFEMYGLGDLVGETDNISVEKYVYWRKEENVYSFPAYRIEIESSGANLEFVMDTEGSVILCLELSLLEKSHEKENKLYRLYNKMLVEYDEGEGILYGDDGVKLLAGYYDFTVDAIGSKIVDYSDGVYRQESYNVYTSTDSYVDIKENQAYINIYYLYGNDGEFIEYKVELSENKIIFNS